MIPKILAQRLHNRPRHALSTARQFKPHLVLLDVDMPGKDGGEVAREIRSDIEMHHTPILFLTALVSKHEAGIGNVVRGGMRFLAKPVVADVLLRSIEDILSTQSASMPG